MCQRVASSEWLAHSPKTIEGVSVKPFVLADLAFLLTAPVSSATRLDSPPTGTASIIA